MTMAVNASKLLLYGMGGHALVLIDACRDMGIEIVGYFDDQAAPMQRDGQNLPPFLGAYRPDRYPELPILIAIGNNEIREQITQRVVHKTFTLIHPSAIVSPTARVNEGSVLL